jgi:hypothetical protein
MAVMIEKKIEDDGYDDWAHGIWKGGMWELPNYVQYISVILLGRTGPDDQKLH